MEVVQPNSTTAPSLLIARSACIEITSERPDGTLIGAPQVTTVPLLFSATLCEIPAAIATTPDKPEGTVV